MGDKRKETLTAPDGTTYRLVSGAYLLELLRSATLQKWEFNREVDEERVARMYDAQKERIEREEGANLFLPTPVTICRYQGALLLMDGQHRLAVLRTLSGAGLVEAGAVSLLLCEVPCATPGDVEDVFVRVNSGTPVPAAYYNRRVGDVLDEFTRDLAARFPGTASPAARPQRPNFNRGRVRDEMSAQLPLRDAIIDRKVGAADLLRAALEENEIEASISQTANRRVPESVAKRAERTGFYLGIREGWAIAVALRAVHPD